MLALPIAGSALATARSFAKQQYSEAKAEQVRLNTLAVWSVGDFLGLMGIATDLEVGDSWNAVVRACADVADLEVVGLGRLECRPLREGERVARVPYEVWDERIGYVFVRIDEARQESAILGFMPGVEAAAIELDGLQSPECLLEHLDDLRSRPACVQLRRWLEAEFSTEWQSVDSLVPMAIGDYAFRGSAVATVATAEATPASISRAKAIDLTQAGHAASVALVMEVRPDSDTSRWRIRLQLHPLQPGSSLPAGMHVEVWDAMNAMFLEARARPTDDCLQIQFRGVEGERFSIRLMLGDREVVEYFQL
ncbi:MAG: DUF1822 family protein [Cyanobacteria bacterium J06639_1]